MTNLQFRVLYREFLFRIVDLELLSQQGDIGKLLGQFAALLIFLSLWFSGAAASFVDSRLPRPAVLIAAWNSEHFLIATTMLVVGLFAVLAWDSTFPNRRDVMVLAPLPVRGRTLFLAKVAAAATALSLTVVTLNCVTSLALPLALAPPSSSPADMILSRDLYRAMAAYWLTMLAAGAFIFCCVLGVQGLAAQLLPRRRFLRVSSFLQMTAFVLFVSVYFLQPSLATPRALTAAENQRLLHWLPSYWFLGLFQALNGSMHPALVPLARRAVAGLLVAGCGTAVAYLLSYLRTLRKIVEEPDIVPGARGGHWLPPFGDSFQTAVVQFSIRTLLRSRQHRVILAFYLGIGFAAAILSLRTPAAQKQLFAASASARWQHSSLPLLVSSIILLGFWVVGTRVVFAMPLELRANWIFRVLPLGGAPECLAAARRSLYVLSVVPACAASAVVFLWVWPWRFGAGHVTVLWLLGTTLAELRLNGFQKIPFTCSYLPGKSNFHMTFWLCFGLLMTLVLWGADFESKALEDPGRSVAMLISLAFVAALARWRTSAEAESELAELQFEDPPPPAIFALEIHKDGVVPM